MLGRELVWAGGTVTHGVATRQSPKMLDDSEFLRSAIGRRAFNSPQSFLHYLAATCIPAGGGSKITFISVLPHRGQAFRTTHRVLRGRDAMAHCPKLVRRRKRSVLRL